MRKTIFITVIALSLIIIGCGKKAKDFDTLSKEGIKALKSCEYNEAVFCFKKALHLKPSDRDMLYNMGIAFKKLSMIDSALSYFGRGRVLYPNDRPINEELLRLCPTVEDYDCALQAIYALIATGDNEEMFWPLLPDYNYLSGKIPQSIEYYRFLIAKYPDQSRSYINLADALRQKEKFDESIEVTVSAIEKFGPNPGACTNIAFNYFDMKKYDQAEIYFRKAIELAPEQALLWINLGNILSERNSKVKKREALQIYKKYLSQTPPIFKLDSLIKTLEVELKNM